MIKFIEKKEWRNNIEACWNVSHKIRSCLDRSKTFSALDQETKSIVKSQVSPAYIKHYINQWAFMGANGPPTGANTLFNNESEFYKKNQESLESLEKDCNLSKLHECCQQRYNLKNLEGHYENYAQKLYK